MIKELSKVFYIEMMYFWVGGEFVNGRRNYQMIMAPLSNDFLFCMVLILVSEVHAGTVLDFKYFSLSLFRIVSLYLNF